jgi:hypothetical protein
MLLALAVTAGLVLMYCLNLVTPTPANAKSLPSGGERAK